MLSHKSDHSIILKCRRHGLSWWKRVILVEKEKEEEQEKEKRMILRWPSSFSPTRKPSSPNRNTTTCNSLKLRSNSIHQCKLEESKNNSEEYSSSSSCSNNSFCLCGRRRFLETAATSLSLLPIYPSNATDLHPDDPMAMLNRVHPPRPDWYEEFYAAAMDKSMKSYEAEIAGYKSQLFANLRGKAKEIVEIGIGTGPNIKYYGSSTGTNVFGIDPNKKMEKYAQAAAKAAGFSSANFKFIQAVAEALPLSDASVDAVVGTLVLCSVKDVATTLQEVRRVLKPGGLYIFVEHVAAKDGTFLRFVQGVLDPLQQRVADGCHLTRETGMNISAAGFSSVDINTAFLSTASLINPHLYGIAYK